MSKQTLLDALHGMQLWGIVGQSRDPSLGNGRCGSNDEFLEAYKALEGEVRCLISENEKLWERVFELEELTDHRHYIPQEWHATLKVENERLRELVRNLYACNGSCHRCVELLGKCEYEKQLRDLGIEV